MSPTISRLVRKSALVSLFLGTLGYMLAWGTLSVMSTFGSQDPANDQMLWRTPLTMIVVGLAVTVVMDLIAQGLKRKPPAMTPSQIAAKVVIAPVLPTPHLPPMAPKLFSPDDQEPRTNPPIAGINSSAASSRM